VGSNHGIPLALLAAVAVPSPIPRPKIAPGEASAVANLFRCSRGATPVEYVVLLGTIAVPLIPTMIALGVWLVGLFENLRNLVVAPMP
jgi:Flp pilus assembly pilin Flp